MKKISIILICSLLTIVSCINKKEDAGEKIRSSFLKRKDNIVLPDSLPNWVNGELYIAKILPTDIALIHTLDITCDGCVRILENLIGYFRKIEEIYGVKIIIIASSAYMDERIKNELVGYPYPIILDEFESFKLKNKIIRDDILCSFLIKDSKVIEVGDLKDVSFQNEVENILKLKKVPEN